MAAAYQLQAQGYNAVSLPFCFSDLLQGPVSSTQQQASTQLCQQLPLAELTAVGTPQSAASSSSAATAWKSGSLHHTQQGATAQAEAGAAAAAATPEPQSCLSLLPNSTTLDRYLWSVQWFLANGLYVILSSSPASCGSNSNNSACATTHSGGSSSSSVGCVQDAAASADAWVRLWRAVVALPDFEGSVRGRVLLLLAQDPDSGSSGQQWASSTTSTGQTLPGELLLLLLFLQQASPAVNVCVQEDWGKVT